ncbi:MAG: hypothetical protein V4556_00555 [Bacteroidota bacterium]
MDIKKINLEVLTNEYRKKGAAAKGYKIVNMLIKDNEEESLRFLLRDHDREQIKSFLEIEERDNIDFLIDYYSILEIALLAGYIHNPLSGKIENEAEYILNNDSLKRYFTDYYPILLPQLLLKQILKSGTKQYFNKKELPESSILFDRFIMLNHFVKEDPDIDQFLWFLDSGSTSGYTISDFWEVLADKNLIEYKLGSDNKHPLNSALWGFIKYIQFLSDFSDLIKDCSDDPILQSAFWHHQSYWFKHMKNKIGDIINIGINNIRQSLDAVDTEELVANKNSYLDSETEVFEWQKNIDYLEGIEDDITYLLDDKWGKPLEVFFNMNE